MSQVKKSSRLNEGSEHSQPTGSLLVSSPEPTLEAHRQTQDPSPAAAAAQSSPEEPRSFFWSIGGLGVSAARAKIVLKLAWPVMVGMVTQTAVNLVDTAMIGRLPGDVSIPGHAALGLSLPLYWAIGGFLASIQIGTQAIVARRYGEGKKKLAGQALMNSLLIGITTAIFVSVAAVLLVPAIFPFFHSDPDVIRWGVPYLQIRLVATTAMVGTLSIKGFFDAIGRTYVHMIVALVMNVLNIFGNWVLIFGNLGAPRMMVSGAALASASSTVIGLLLMIAWTMHSRVQADYIPYRLANRSKEVLWNIVRISVPSGIATVAMMSGFLLFMKIGAGLDEVAGHGAVYTASIKVVIDIMSLTFMTCLAFGTATATLVGQSLGRGKPRRAELFGWESMKMAAYVFTIVGVITLLWPELFLGIFSKDAQVIEAARPVLRLIACVQGLIAAALILMQANFGAGNSKFVMKVELFLHFLCMIPLAYGLGIAADLGLLGMWLSVVVYVVLLTLVLGYKFHQGKWKESRV